MSSTLSDFDFDLPESLIAQRPAEHRSDSQLLVVRKNPAQGLPQFEVIKFSELPDLVASTELLRSLPWVRNRSHVFKARFYVRRPTGGRHEIVLLQSEPNFDGLYPCMIRKQGEMKFPQRVFVESDGEDISSFELWVPGPRLIDLSSLGEQPLKKLASYSEMPLPPYIKDRRPVDDELRYQPVWADPAQSKSCAAPTASLHFDEALLTRLDQSGVQFEDLFLHVGAGTFEPLSESLPIEKQELHSENFEISEDFAAEVARCQQPSYLAVGTTSARVLESIHPNLERSQKTNVLWRGPSSGATKLFIHPGFKYNAVQALLTNFHLPQSSLFMLVAAFADLKLAHEAYRYAIARKLRFFSYGDASLWI